MPTIHEIYQSQIFYVWIECIFNLKLIIPNKYQLNFTYSEFEIEENIPTSKPSECMPQSTHIIENN